MTTFTNSKLTDEHVSNATLIRLILWADQHNSHYVVAALRELQERRKADSVPVEINDDMAYAFHHALSDSSLGADEVEEIKAGLRAAFANVTIQPEPVVPDEIALAIENLKQKLVECNRYNYCADAVKGVEDACRAAMLHGAEPVSQTYKLNKLSGNSPATPDSWISCSERMPDTKTAVLVAVEFDRKGDWRMKWATYIPGHPDANDGWIIPGASWKPSHWMPLPEPPQEVNQ
ncbi:DUF551 domain-containing protein [Escherichia albertii]|uniref:DUF551 domain-containing protein n=1 Tax=Escherichia albertii TaxID=208962 RepID=UPI00211A639E|nr:DUF551 domain-containing protein [Escherichia albertii]MCQ9020962.1 DUF551 domain-containing protein [Escherichia albertii]MCQ9034614.1 DUF551 domain-containing protein [Escherichia albertii]